MSERSKPNNLSKNEGRLVEQFYSGIRAKRLPILEADAQAFASAVVEYDPPASLFYSLVKSMQYIDEAEFAEHLQTMVDLAKPFAAKTYNLLSHERVCSNMWVYRQMRGLGLPKPRNILIGDDYEDERALVVDDFSISGSIITEYYPGMPREADYQVVLGSATEFALDQMAKYGINPLIANPNRILTLKEILSSREMQFLADLVHEVPFGGFTDDDCLFWTYYKVPDNVNGLFTDKGRLPPLIRPEDFPQPYRKKRREKHQKGGD